MVGSENFLANPFNTCLLTLAYTSPSASVVVMFPYVLETTKYHHIPFTTK